jgi:uncharacterized protein (TIGR03437 family)
MLYPLEYYAVPRFFQLLQRVKYEMKYLSCLAFLPLIVFSSGLVFAQTTFCTTSAVPPIVHAEGFTERVGDIRLACTGAPNVTLTGNFTFILTATVTNRLSNGNTLTGIVFTVDSGSGPQPVLVQPLMVNQNSLVFNGVPVAFSPQGTANLAIAGIRVNATQVVVQTPITASVAINAAGFPITTSPLVVGTPERGLYTGSTGTLICAQNGSPLPSTDPNSGDPTITFTSLVRAGTSFTSTRVTEGFASAFGPKSAPAYFNADSGQRIIVQYSGFPSDAQLFIPDVVAGSDAIQATAGGDFEVPASGGAYAPSVNGSLLLARVAGANSNGAGGSPVYTPGPLGSGTVTFDTVTQIPIVNGTAIAVYEVVDADSSALETAQFPTFLGLLPNGSRTPSQTSESVFFAPLSAVATASATEPIPRFAAIAPLPDCTLIGDCGFVQGTLSVNTTPLQFSEPSGGITGQLYFTLQNTGGGRMSWTATVNYLSGSGWLSLDPTQGVNSTTVRVYATPANLAPATYQATVQVNAGTGGTASVPVTFVVTQAATSVTVPVTTAKTGPAIASVVNAASFAPVPVVPGSLTTIMGTAFTGTNVSATFNTIPATILFSNNTQINVLVPSDLASGASAQLVVTVDGSNSAPTTVQVAPFEPAIFPNALLNQDGTLNSADNAASLGSVVYFFGTGLSGNGQISVHIGNQEIDALYYAGPAPGLPGVQQVNLVVPSGLGSGTANLYVCGSSNSNSSNGATVCSVPVPVTLQ